MKFKYVGIVKRVLKKSFYLRYCYGKDYILTGFWIFIYCFYLLINFLLFFLDFCSWIL